MVGLNGEIEIKIKGSFFLVHTDKTNIRFFLRAGAPGHHQLLLGTFYRFPTPTPAHAG